MKGEIISVEKVLMGEGSAHSLQTVIYERDGERYRGCMDFRGEYYFGGGGLKAKFSSDIDTAFEQGYPEAGK